MSLEFMSAYFWGVGIGFALGYCYARTHQKEAK